MLCLLLSWSLRTAWHFCSTVPQILFGGSGRRVNSQNVHKIVQEDPCALLDGYLVGRVFPGQVAPDRSQMCCSGSKEPREAAGRAGLTYTVWDARASLRISWVFQTKINPLSSEAGDVFMPRWDLIGGFQFGILPELGAVSTGIHLFIFSFDRWFWGVY